VIYHDKYKEYIETAKKINQKYTDSIEFHQGDINEIDYIQNNSIDLIYCNVSFFYSKNDRKLLKDLEKKLKI